MNAEITEMEIKHKYIIFTYDITDGDEWVDTHTIQYCLEGGLPTKEKIETVLRNCLYGYGVLDIVDEDDLRKEFIGLKI